MLILGVVGIEMRFIDEAKIIVHSGKGGDGCSSFRRERHVPFGGPDGADGGKGGDVVFIATSQRNTLQAFRGHAIWRAKNGQQGGARNCTGASAPSIEIFVPLGTRVFDAQTQEQLIDLTTEGQRWIAAKGGRGGLGNLRFKSSVNRTPRKSTPGKPGESKQLRMELMLMADVGLVGFPNAGKSTFISKISSARPKVADYPFTTLAPSLGVVDMGVEGTFVVADIPGLIRGASQGAGLGLQFLRHIRRTRVLLHLISLGPDEEESPIERYRAIRKELETFDASLGARHEIVFLTKTDLLSPQEKQELTKKFHKDVHPVVVLDGSSVTGEGIAQIKHHLFHLLQRESE